MATRRKKARSAVPKAKKKKKAVRRGSAARGKAEVQEKPSRKVARSARARTGAAPAAPVSARRSKESPVVSKTTQAPPARGMGKGAPPPFVVARGEEPFRVLDEALKYAGLFDLLEELLARSGKRREMFEIAAKVDFLHAPGREEAPASYVDPKLVAHLFDQLLDRGFRLLRVVETRNETARYHRHRSVKEAGRLLGYDESCYDLKDLAEEMFPVAFSGTWGNLPTGRIWHQADCRIVFAKNRTDELFGPALGFYNLYSTLAAPTTLIALEKGIDPPQFVLQVLNALPIHFALIDAIGSRDGSLGSGGPYELLSDADGSMPEGPAILRTNTILAGRDLLAVEAAGHKMQGVEPLSNEVFRALRRAGSYRPPAEIDSLPVHTGWKSLGNQIREVLDAGRPAEASRVGLWQLLRAMDVRAFPPQPGAFLAIRLQRQVEQFLGELKLKRGIVATANGNAE